MQGNMIMHRGYLVWVLLILVLTVCGYFFPLIQCSFVQALWKGEVGILGLGRINSVEGMAV